VRTVNLHEVFKVGRDGHTADTWPALNRFIGEDCRTRSIQPLPRIDLVSPGNATGAAGTSRRGRR
jgi:hypothetical protein